MIIIREPKTDDGREVPINIEARKILEPLVKLAQSKGWQYLFTNPKTGMRYVTIKRAWKTACSQAGIKDL